MVCILIHYHFPKQKRPSKRGSLKQTNKQIKEQTNKSEPDHVSDEKDDGGEREFLALSSEAVLGNNETYISIEH